MRNKKEGPAGFLSLLAALAFFGCERREEFAKAEQVEVEEEPRSVPDDSEAPEDG